MLNAYIAHNLTANEICWPFYGQSAGQHDIAHWPQNYDHTKDQFSEIVPKVASMTHLSQKMVNIPLCPQK